MATVSMVSEERPRVVLWPRLEPFEFGILHCQDRGSIAKLNAAVRMFFAINAHLVLYLFLFRRLVSEEVYTAQQK